MAMKELYKTLKDHKNGFMQDLVQSSYQTIYQDEVQRFMNETDEIDLEECGGESVVRVIVVNQSFQPSLSSAISNIGPQCVQNRRSVGSSRKERKQGVRD